MISVYINDFSTQHRTHLLLEHAELCRIAEVWDNDDRLLRDLQSTAFFAGRTTWAALDIDHWRVLIANNLDRVGRLDETLRTDVDHPTVASLSFLISGLVYCLQERGGFAIEVMHINRAQDYEVGYDFTASLRMGIRIPKPRETNGLRVVVDNTDEE